MELEAILSQKEHFGYTSKDLYDLLEGNWGCEFGLPEQEEEEYGSFEFHEGQINNSNHTNWNSPPPTSSIWPYSYLDQWGANNPNSSSEVPDTTSIYPCEEFQQLDPISTRPRPRRSRSKKNMEEIESQRMTHIAVERNRRKQMNEYLSALRGLMPDSYVQRGDQASIVGGAINYVKELEHKLHFLGGEKRTSQKFEAGTSSLPFDEFFAFPQYSTSSTTPCESSGDPISANADIEVTVVESHANLKIRTRKRPKQLMKMVSGLQSLRLTVLHLNVSTVDQTVLYSLSVKVEDDCSLTSVDEIAAAVNQMLGRIQPEAALL
ncbi:hypothetical protein RHSIM_Rhsim07G0180500 [Rhododendron simsii]|uniref:BHLH domain-containing protein n=1 Tax=Rhododendron simsii TaxID=118357 RepID=A0A834LKI3_RHOSS|nr:hypothetical protein RHSIM_Rhsim07G0180500 [Rhododendron simsii]